MKSDIKTTNKHVTTVGNTQGEALQLPGKVSGTGSHKLSSYELPACETDKERRTFPGWNVKEHSTALMDAVSEEGTTNTRGGMVNKSHTCEAGELKRNFE